MYMLICIYAWNESNVRTSFCWTCYFYWTMEHIRYLDAWWCISFWEDTNSLNSCTQDSSNSLPGRLARQKGLVWLFWHQCLSGLHGWMQRTQIELADKSRILIITLMTCELWLINWLGGEMEIHIFIY